MSIETKNKTVVVTEASSGIGQGIMIASARGCEWLLIIIVMKKVRTIILEQIMRGGRGFIHKADVGKRTRSFYVREDGKRIRHIRMY